MTKKNSKDQNIPEASSEMSHQAIVWIAVGAILAAAAPHFFLDTPIDFYKQNNLRGWLGLSIWSPAFLAAVALFFGADGSVRVKEPLIRQADTRLASSILMPVVVVVYLGFLYFDGYQRVGAWSELGLAMLLYAGIFALGTFFWQGFFQARLFENFHPGRWQRVLVALLSALLTCALWLPFLLNHPWTDIWSNLSGLIAVYLGLALIFEFGLSVLGCAAIGCLMGVAWAWSHQMLFY